MREPHLKTIVIDDEAKVRDVITHYVQQIPHLAYCGNAASVPDAMELIQHAKPDLLLLDIDMPGQNGLGIFKLLRAYKQNCNILFVTGYKEYAIDAIREAGSDFPIGWLSKPITQDALALAVQKFQPIVSYGNGNSSPHPRLEFQTDQGLLLIHQDEIVYCEADGGYTTIFLTDEREKVMISENLGKIERKIVGGDFFRCHQSYLIRWKCVRTIRRKPMSCDLLMDGKLYPDIPVSRAKFMELKRKCGLG